MKRKSMTRGLVVVFMVLWILCFSTLSVESAGVTPVKGTSRVSETPVLFPAGDNFLFGYLNEQGRWSFPVSRKPGIFQKAWHPWP